MIRRAKLGDLESLLLIEEQSFNFDKFTKEKFAYFITKEDLNYFLVFEKDKKIAGYLLATFQSKSTKMRIYSIAVLPDQRRKQIANKLLNEMEKMAVNSQKNLISCEIRVDNSSSKKFFECNGYKKIAIQTNYYEDSCDASIYEKALS